MIDGINNLEYLDIYNVNNGNTYITNSQLNRINNLTICQDKNFINNPKTNNICCLWIIEQHKCFNS